MLCLQGIDLKVNLLHNKLDINQDFKPRHKCKNENDLVQLMKTSFLFQRIILDKFI